jgi:hypothetical protein
MNFPRLITRAISAWSAHRLAKRCKRNTERLARMCPDLARENARRAEAQKRHRAVRNIERRQRAIMNGLLEG